MITFNDFKRLIRPIQRKIQLVLGRAILSLITNTEGTQFVQIKALNGEIISDMERFQEYGFESYPHTGAEVFAGFLNGNRNKGVVLCIHDRRYRPKDLVEGEACMYTDEDQETDEHRYHLKRNQTTDEKGKIKEETFATSHKITSPVQERVATTSDKITTPLHEVVSSDIKLGTGVLRAFIDSRFAALFNKHNHSGVTVGAGNTGVPNSSVGATHMTTHTKGS